MFGDKATGRPGLLKAVINTGSYNTGLDAIKFIKDLNVIKRKMFEKFLLLCLCNDHLQKSFSSCHAGTDRHKETVC